MPEGDGVRELRLAAVVATGHAQLEFTCLTEREHHDGRVLADVLHLVGVPANVVRGIAVARANDVIESHGALLIRHLLLEEGGNLEDDRDSMERPVGEHGAKLKTWIPVFAQHRRRLVHGSSQRRAREKELLARQRLPAVAKLWGVGSKGRAR